MAEPSNAAPKPCCVCAAPNGKHCAKCKSRHYCSKACQLVDWKRGHNKACRQLAAEFQDRLLDAITTAKKPKEAPAIVEDVLTADGSKAAARLPAARATAVIKATALNGDRPDWRGTCAICLDALPLEGNQKIFYSCCRKKICVECSNKCDEYDERCPLCRAAAPTSEAEFVRRVQQHADKGHAEAQVMLGGMYRDGDMGLQQNFKRAVQLYQLAAAQGNAEAQINLGSCYALGQGVKIDYKTAALWYRRAAEQGHPNGQYNLGLAFYVGEGATQSYVEAVKWYRLAAAQDQPNALFQLGACHTHGHGVARDLDEALRLCKRAAAKGHADAAEMVDKFLRGSARRVTRKSAPFRNG